MSREYQRNVAVQSFMPTEGERPPLLDFRQRPSDAFLVDSTQEHIKHLEEIYAIYGVKFEVFNNVQSADEFSVYLPTIRSRKVLYICDFTNFTRMDGDAEISLIMSIGRIVGTTQRRIYHIIRLDEATGAIKMLDADSNYQTIATITNSSFDGYNTSFSAIIDLESGEIEKIAVNGREFAVPSTIDQPAIKSTAGYATILFIHTEGTPTAFAQVLYLSRWGLMELPS